MAEHFELRSVGSDSMRSIYVNSTADARVRLSVEYLSLIGAAITPAEARQVAKALEEAATEVENRKPPLPDLKPGSVVKPPYMQPLFLTRDGKWIGPGNKLDHTDAVAAAWDCGTLTIIHRAGN